jgi:ABC-type cobalamin/Fe3+-siderophores transport system ATPase subunit
MSRSALRYAAVKVMSDKEFRQIVTEADEKMMQIVMEDFELDEKEAGALQRLAQGERAEVALAEFFNQAVPY